MDELISCRSKPLLCDDELSYPPDLLAQELTPLVLWDSQFFELDVELVDLAVCEISLHSWDLEGIRHVSFSF